MKVDHIAILVEDLNISREWYEKYCSAVVVYEDHKYIRMKFNNIYLALISKWHYDHSHFGILVDSVDEFPEGGKIVHHRDNTIGCYMFDPSGNMIEFIYYSPEARKQFLS